MKRRRTRTGSDVAPTQSEKVAKGSAAADMPKSNATADDKVAESDATTERRAAVKDCNSFEKACEEIKNSIREIHRLKQEGHEHAVC